MADTRCDLTDLLIRDWRYDPDVEVWRVELRAVPASKSEVTS